MPKTQTAFDRCIVIFNPVSTCAKRMEWRIAELAQLFPGDSLVVLHTSADGRAANAELLVRQAAKLGPRTLLAIIAGDGTINELVNTLLHDKRLSSEARQTVLLPLWGGNGNDLAHMVNGRRRRRPVHRLLAVGRAVAVHPITFQLGTVNGQMQRVSAVSYASFGASAYTAHQLDQAELGPTWTHLLPGVRFLHELVLVVWAMIRAPRSKIIIDGVEQAVYEQLFINGSRFAKVSALALPITKKTFCYARVINKHPLSILRAISELVRGYQMDDADTSQGSIFVLQADTWAQFDGEVVELSAGTRVSAGLSPRLVRILSTKY
ncbi:MAG: diacylglycerol kinase family protein [Candidatus Saccharimonadales bacterium]